MATADFLQRFGLLIVRGFLTDAWCRRVRAELRTQRRSPTTVVKGGRHIVRESARKATISQVSDETEKFVRARFEAILPKAAEYFAVPLAVVQNLQFLVYAEGDYYHAHQDISRDSSTHAAGRRKVSCVLFLNGQRDVPSPDSFQGGSLVFYGLLKAAGMESRGIPLDPEQGMLIAFRSELVHEVVPVANGERFTVVTWFADR